MPSETSREGGNVEQSVGEHGGFLKKFSTGISNNFIPQAGKWKGIELTTGWRAFDTFDLRKNVLTLDHKETIPVSELEDVLVEELPDDPDQA